jgi:glycosyltransferase involved in cell wall biosynthesis
VSKIGGFVDIVDQGENGYLVELTDVSRFALVLREMLTQKALLEQCRKASLKKALQFDSVPIAKRYEQIFFEVCSSN